MSVNLKHFVDISIKQHVASAVIGTRKTVALFTAEEKQSATYPLIVNASNYEVECEGMSTTIAYLKVFFAHGGQEAAVYGDTSTSTFTADVIMSLPQEYICVAYASSSSNHDDMHTLAMSLENQAEFYGINRKVLLSRVDLSAVTSGTFSLNAGCLAVKVSSEVGAEMTIAAYLSKINVYDMDSVYDYMYTTEQITPQELSDSEYETVIAKNCNVDIELAGATRNCGGNMSDGSDIVNSYVLILLHQTTTARLVQLLSQKIKSEDGISKIYAVISQELGNYLTCGYLTTDKVWTDPDLIISYNNEQYTVVETGTALTDGYIVKVLPFSSLTTNDKALHKTPPIYVVLASQYGIRAITINGEVI